MKEEVVFLPWRAACWGTMEGAWREAKEDPHCEVLVIPIPWYYREPGGGLRREAQYEGGDFPEDVPVTDYRGYDFSSRHPRRIFFQNPYDQYSWSSSVDPAFYSDRLRRYTDCLVYIPWFLAEEVDPSDPEDGKAVYNMRYYVTTPGVVQADIVLVQSERMRKAYVEILTRAAGEDTRPIWEGKVRCQRAGGDSSGISGSSNIL